MIAMPYFLFNRWHVCTTEINVLGVMGSEEESIVHLRSQWHDYAFLLHD